MHTAHTHADTETATYVSDVYLSLSRAERVRPLVSSPFDGAHVRGKHKESAEAYGIRHGKKVQGHYIHDGHVYTGLFATIFGRKYAKGRATLSCARTYQMCISYTNYAFGGAFELETSAS